MVEIKDVFDKPRYVAGVDVAYTKRLGIGVAIVLGYDTLKVMEESVVKVPCEFPYIPTFLSFREGPIMIKAIDGLRVDPDVCLIDGQGLAHPLRCGLATHVGVLLKKATVGVAKKPLCGKLGEFVGKWAPMTDNGEVIGAAYRPSHDRKTLFVSVGNLITLEKAMFVVEGCTRKGDLIPLKLAHDKAVKERNVTTSRS
jgi:deoxyribonuclease V